MTKTQDLMTQQASEYRKYSFQGKDLSIYPHNNFHGVKPQRKISSFCCLTNNHCKQMVYQIINRITQISLI